MLKGFTLAVLLVLPTTVSAKDPPPQPEPTVKPDWSTVRIESEQAVRARLVDPASAVISWEGGFQWMYYRGFKRLWGWAGCGTVNAKNSMGGYVGARGFAVVYEQGVKHIDMEQSGRWQGIQEACLRFPPPQPELTQTTETTKGPQPSVADEIAKLLKLRTEGAITEAEFQTLKQKLILQP